MAKKEQEENLSVEEENGAGTEEPTTAAEEAGPVVEGIDGEVAGEVPVDYQAEALQNKDLYLRALADLENYRKRAQREKEDAIRFANGNLLREMIPVIDNLERAVEHASTSEDQDQVLLEGVQMTLVQFRKVLEGFGAKVLSALGEQFNPEFHQAMGEMVTSDQPPGMVAQELQKGYTLNGRLLRPAMVMIAKAPESEEAESNEDEVEPDESPENE